MTTSSLQKRPDVVVDPPIGNHRIVLCEPTHRYFRLGVREASFLASLDGTRSREELCTENQQGFSTDQVDRLLDWFGAQNLLGSEPLTQPKQVSPWYSKLWRFVARPDQLRVTLFNPDPLLTRFRPLTDVLFSRPAVAAYLLIFLSPAVVYLVAPGLALHAAQQTHTLSVEQWFLLYGSMLGVIVLHELAHAITCKHFGGEVKKIGVMFLYLSPVVYCDVSASWRFVSVQQKFIVTVAGIFLQFLLSTAGLTLWMINGSSFLLQFVVFNFVLAFLNFFPFIKLDGYWMLVHLLNEPNLKTKGLAAVNGSFNRLLRRKPQEDAGFTNVILLYGIGNILAIPAFWAFGLYGVYRRLAPLSPALAYVVLGIFLGPLMYRMAKSVSSFGRVA